jgi:hypothetical protein
VVSAGTKFFTGMVQSGHLGLVGLAELVAFSRGVGSQLVR